MVVVVVAVVLVEVFVAVEASGALGAAVAEVSLPFGPDTGTDGNESTNEAVVVDEEGAKSELVLEGVSASNEGR